MKNTEQLKKKTYLGKVVSDKMEKTITVETERTYTHPTFHKIMCQTKKYKVHDAEQQASLGDIVEFYEGRPVSKTKYMYLKSIVKKG